MLTQFNSLISDKGELETQVKSQLTLVLDEIIKKDLKGYAGIYKYAIRESFAVVPAFTFLIQFYYKSLSSKNSRIKIGQKNRHYANFIVQFKNMLLTNSFDAPLSGCLAIAWLKTVGELKSKAKAAGEIVLRDALKQIHADMSATTKQTFTRSKQKKPTPLKKRLSV